MDLHRPRTIKGGEIMEYSKENLTTIAVFIYMLISPFLTTYGVSIDESMFTTAIMSIGGLLLAIKSAKHPNKLEILGNNESLDDDTC